MQKNLVLITTELDYQKIQGFQQRNFPTQRISQHGTHFFYYFCAAPVSVFQSQYKNGGRQIQSGQAKQRHVQNPGKEVIFLQNLFHQQ